MKDDASGTTVPALLQRSFKFSESGCRKEGGFNSTPGVVTVQPTTASHERYPSSCARYLLHAICNTPIHSPGIRRLSSSLLSYSILTFRCAWPRRVKVPATDVKRTRTFKMLRTIEAVQTDDQSMRTLRTSQTLSIPGPLSGFSAVHRSRHFNWTFALSPHGIECCVYTKRYMRA